MAAKNEMRLKLDTTEWNQFALRAQTKISARGASAVYAILETEGKKMENFARTRSIWQNRTGNARKFLLGGAEVVDKNTVAAFVGHGVEYGIYLEYRWQRKYAILEKSVQAYSVETSREIGKLLGKLR